MPYDPGLADRLREILCEVPNLIETKMFGGIVYLLYGNMSVGVYKDLLILRVGEIGARALLKEAHVRAMDITGRPMKGWVMVAPEGIEDDDMLCRYLHLSLDFVEKLPPKGGG